MLLEWRPRSSSGGNSFLEWGHSAPDQYGPVYFVPAVGPSTTLETTPPFGLAGLARPDLAWLAWLGLACLAWPGLFLASSAAAAPSARTTTSAASGGAGALRAPFVVVVAEGAAAADDTKNKPGQAKQDRPSQATQAKLGQANPGTKPKLFPGAPPCGHKAGTNISPLRAQNRPLHMFLLGVAARHAC